MQDLVDMFSKTLTYRIYTEAEGINEMINI